MLPIKRLPLPAGKSAIKISRRSIVIPKSKHKKPKPIRRKIRHVTLEEIDPDEVMGIKDPRMIEFKVKQLQEFTRNLKHQIKSAEASQTKAEGVSQSSTTTEEHDTTSLFNELVPEKTLHDNTKSLGAAANVKNLSLSDMINTLSGNQLEKLIPDDAKNVINDNEMVTKALLNKKRENWNTIIDGLFKNKLQLNEISETTIHEWLLPNVKSLSYNSINKLDTILDTWSELHHTPMSSDMYSLLLAEYGRLPLGGHMAPKGVKNDLVLQKIDAILNRMDADNIKPTEFNLTACVTYASKLRSINLLNTYLTRFQDKYGVTPNKHTFTKIIQFYDKIGLDERAWNTFDTMKFLSTSHHPDIFTYNAMLKLCDKERNYAKAIDLFYEIQEAKLEPNNTTTTLIAKTLACCSNDSIVSEGNSESLKLLGWKFIEKMFGNDDLGSVTSMMALAAYDGDAGLCRAIFFKYTMGEFAQKCVSETDTRKAWLKSINPILLNYLFVAYSKFSPDKVPLLLGWTEGSQMRRTILNSVDYTGRTNNSTSVLPMLPILELASVEHILAESNALWKFCITNGDALKHNIPPEIAITSDSINSALTESPTFDDFKTSVLNKIARQKMAIMNPDVFNNICLTSYLTIPLRLGNESEFWNRLESYTFKESVLDAKLLALYYENKLLTTRMQVNQNDGEQVQNEPFTNIMKSDSSNELVSYLAAIYHQLLYNSATFELAMKGATKFGNSKRAREAWTDRGEFRKTAGYVALDDRVKNKLDSNFAKIMLDFFVSQKVYDEALGIVLSSKRYIKWTYGMVKNLFHGLEHIEDDRSAKILMDVINRKPTGISYINKQLEDLDLR